MITPTADDIADELYGLAPEQFTETREARARELRASGYADIADEVGRMRRPTQVAWLANVLVRRHGREMEFLLGLGAEFRAALQYGDRPQRAALSARRRGAVRALVALAADVASCQGRTLGGAAQRALEETLEAAVADEQAAAALRSARLTGALRHVGFGDPAALMHSTPNPEPTTARATGRVTGRVTAPTSPPKRRAGTAAADAAAAAARAQLDAAVQRATQAVEGFEQALASADTELDDHRRHHDALVARRRRLEDELATVGRELVEAKTRLERSRRERARLVRALRTAEHERDGLAEAGLRPGPRPLDRGPEKA